MAGSHLSAEYANIMLFRLLEILYDAKGKGAKFRTCILGKDDLVKHYHKSGLRFVNRSWEENRDRCRDFLRKMGVVDDLGCDIKDNMANIWVHACVHYPMEKMLKREEVPPYTCIPANLLACGIEKGAGKQTEVAKIQSGKRACRITLLVFEDES